MRAYPAWRACGVAFLAARSERLGITWWEGCGGSWWWESEWLHVVLFLEREKRAGRAGVVFFTQFVLPLTHLDGHVAVLRHAAFLKLLDLVGALGLPADARHRISLVEGLHLYE